MKPVGKRRTPRCAIDLILDVTNAERDSIDVFLCCPAHGAALARSKRSTRNERRVARRCIRISMIVSVGMIMSVIVMAVGILSVSIAVFIGMCSTGLGVC